MSDPFLSPRDHFYRLFPSLAKWRCAACGKQFRSKPNSMPDGPGGIVIANPSCPSCGVMVFSA